MTFSLDQLLATIADIAPNRWSMAAARFLKLMLGFVSRDQRSFGFVQERTLPLLNTAVYKRFMAEGIEIPFPQRDVHLYPVPSVEPPMSLGPFYPHQPPPAAPAGRSNG